MPKLVTTTWMCDRCMETYESDAPGCAAPQIPPRWARFGEAYFCHKHELTFHRPPARLDFVEVRCSPPVVYLVDRVSEDDLDGCVPLERSH